MKKLLIIIVILKAGILCYSQDSSQFIDTNKLWSVLTYFPPYDGPAVIPRHATHYLKIGAYLTLGDTVYYKLLRSDDKEHSVWYDYGYIREDTTGKVFYKITENTDEGLIYYGNAKEGDTLIVSTRNNNQLYQWEIIVTSVDSISLSGDMRKRISFRYETWIERIGAMSGFIYNSPGWTGGNTYILLCFKQNDSLIYIMPSFKECFVIYTGKEEIKNKENIRVFPNPVVNGSLHIQFQKQEDYIIEITNITGELIKEFWISGKDYLEISVDSMNKGFYLIRIRDLHNDVLYKNKFIIV